MAGVWAGGVLLPYNDIRLLGCEQPSESVGPFQSQMNTQLRARHYLTLQKFFIALLLNQGKKVWAWYRVILIISNSF